MGAENFNIETAELIENALGMLDFSPPGISAAKELLTVAVRRVRRVGPLGNFFPEEPIRLVARADESGNELNAQRCLLALGYASDLGDPETEGLWFKSVLGRNAQLEKNKAENQGLIVKIWSYASDA